MHKKMFSSFILISSMVLFSGCTAFKTAITTIISPFVSESTLPSEIIISVSGTITKENSLFSSYNFESENSEIFSIHTADGFSKNLEEYVNKKVVIKGLLSHFSEIKNSKNISFEKNIKIIDITHFQEKNKSSSWQVFIPEYFDISFFHPNHNFEIEEKIITRSDEIPTSRIITKYNNDVFYTISKNIENGWQKRFKQEGTEIQVGNLQIQRLFSGKQILFYIPNLDIQVDYWGDIKDIHLFYTIIKTIKIVTKDEEKKMIEKKIIEKKQVNAQIDKPSISVIIEQIVMNPSQALESSDDYTDRIIINSIEYFGSFVSIEYKILGNDKHESVLKAVVKKKLFSVEWKSIFMKTLFLQQLVEWEQGDKYLWKIKTGNTPNIGIYTNKFLRNINLKFISELPKTFIQFISPEYKYSIVYPKKMYYEVFTNNDTIEGVKWSNAPLHTEETNTDIFTIKLSIVKGNKDMYTEQYSTNTIIIPKSSSAYFLLQGSKDIAFSVLQYMAQSITLY